MSDYEYQEFHELVAFSLICCALVHTVTSSATTNLCTSVPRVPFWTRQYWLLGSWREKRTVRPHTVGCNVPRSCSGAVCGAHRSSPALPGQCLGAGQYAPHSSIRVLPRVSQWPHVARTAACCCFAGRTTASRSAPSATRRRAARCRPAAAAQPPRCCADASRSTGRRRESTTTRARQPAQQIAYNCIVKYVTRTTRGDVTSGYAVASYHTHFWARLSYSTSSDGTGSSVIG